MNNVSHSQNNWFLAAALYAPSFACLSAFHFAVASSPFAGFSFSALCSLVFCVMLCSVSRTGASTQAARASTRPTRATVSVSSSSIGAVIVPSVIATVAAAIEVVIRHLIGLGHLIRIGLNLGSDKPHEDEMHTADIRRPVVRASELDLELKFLSTSFCF
ncbi:hypothetical protein E6O75_ATG09977 [Venturia nashicola]|uniref:Uncharacterized protein n=1 Tax=Venturia nashicola TaxID=86259 RepID=A0A4Z1NEK9_9PEZI|nr:hypothetical protein E6O75_ATG09977 [Venturia nashicola]